MSHRYSRDTAHVEYRKCLADQNAFRRIVKLLYRLERGQMELQLHYSAHMEKGAGPSEAGAKVADSKEMMYSLILVNAF